MAISTQIQNLNLIPGKSAPVVVHLSQGNVGNTVQFYLYDGDNPYYPTNVSIAVHGVRADNTVFGPYAVSVTSGSNLVSFDIVSAMTSVNGAAIGELVLTDGNENQIGSANFGMLVEATPYSSSVTYEDDLSIYQRILAYVKSSSALIEERINTATSQLDTKINTATSQLDTKINTEISRATNSETTLGTRIDQIVAPSGEAPSAAEITDARISYNGVVYDSLGTAIRTQTKAISELTTNEIAEKRPDSSSHSVISTEALRFWDVIIPEDALIQTLTIPVGSVGASAYLQIGIWELDDTGTTITKVKTCQAVLKANSDVTVQIWHKSNKKRYISQIQHNCNIYCLSNQTGHHFLLANGSTASTSTLTLSDIWTYSNMYLVGNIVYSKLSEKMVLVDKKITKKVELPWRRGAFGNDGVIYASEYPIMTDLFIPTSAIDRFTLSSDSGHNAMIGYYDRVNGEMIYRSNAIIYYGYTHTIDKTHDYFIIRIFINWSTAINPDDGNNIVNAYKDFDYSDVEKYAYDTKPLKYERDAISGSKKRNLDFISISHQGFSLYEMPNHNLQPGYVEAAKRGFDYGETDLRLTSDNVLVCCHDDSFVDTSTQNTIVIADHTYTELQQYNYYGGKIASFDDIVKTCKMNGIGILIDQLTVDRLPLAIDTITKYGMWKNTKWFVVYYPDYPTAISDYTTPILNANRNASLYVVAQNDVTASIAFAKTIKTPYNEVLIHLPYTGYTVQNLIDLLPQMGDELGFSVYTIDNLTTFKQYMPYVKAIISNQISTTDALF